MSREILQDIINEFDLNKFIRFFRNKSQNFAPRQELISEYDDEFFSDSTILGEIKFVDTGERLMVCTLRSHGPLSERASKKAQYEKGRKILKAYQQDAGIFIFYDTPGNFRLSLIYPQYFGAKRTWNNFRRFTYFVSKTFANKTFLIQISSSDFSSLDKIKEAFSIAKVTDDFYKEFMPKFEKIAHSVRRESKEADADQKAHDFALLFGIRIIFLGFIQKRGWLGSDEKFLQNFLKEYSENNSKKDKFYKQWLRPLFFEALNSPIGCKVAYGKNAFSKETEKKLQMAPYLNGGLFQEKEIDVEGFSIPDNIIQEFFDFLFSYNFTIEENTLYDEDLELNPEFLGIIFERLVNKADGAVYTPRTEVDLMCRLALVKWLEQNVSETVKKESLYELLFREGGADESYEPLQKQGIFSRSEIDQILSLLENITVCDPAVGSGAFPVGMLHVLDEVEERLRKRIGREEEVSEFERKKRIINQSLYGVEVKEWAVWITQLRLWTTLFIDAPDKMRHSLEPILPSLDFKIRKGDSLVQKIGTKTFPVSGHFDIPENVKKKIIQLRNLKAEYFQNKVKNAWEIRQKEFGLFKEILLSEISEKKKKISMLKGVKPNQQLSFFDEPEKQKQKEIDFNKGKIVELELEIKELMEELNFLTEDKPLIWNIEFAEIFSDKGGFDIVIGNPPYVRHEDISDPTGKVKDKKRYKELLTEMVRLDFPNYFSQKSRINAQSDLYTYFYIRGLRLLNSKGVHTFICSNSWLDVGYGVWLQEFLLKSAPIECIIDNHVKRSFESADVNTIISVIHAPDKNINENHIVKFVTIKKPFEDAIFTEYLVKIEEARKVVSNDIFRVYPVMVQSLEKNGSEYEDESQKRMKLGTYVGDKWGGKYLRAPDIYFEILEKGKEKLVRLGEIADLKFGIKTGADSFFYLTKNQAKAIGIEKEFLTPILVSSDQAKTFETSINNTDMYLVTTNKAKEEIIGTKYFDYLMQGEKEKFNGRGGASVPAGRPSCKGHRPFWYSINIPPIPPIYWMEMRRERYFTLYNQAKLSADHTFYGVYPHKGIDEYILCALLNSTLVPLFVEIFANDPGGGGTTLQTPTGETKRHILLPSSLIGSKELANSFYKLSKRDSKSILEECGFSVNDNIREQEPRPLPDRAELDNIVFDVLGLNKDERKEVYWAVCELVKNRIKKAKSA